MAHGRVVRFIALPLALTLAAAAGLAPRPSSATVSGDALNMCSQEPLDAAAATPVPKDGQGGVNCPTLCDKWLAACKGAASAIKSCWLKTIAQVVKVRTAACKANTNVLFEQVCLALLDTEEATARATALESNEDGAGFCETVRSFSCEDICDN